MPKSFLTRWSERKRLVDGDQGERQNKLPDSTAQAASEPTLTDSDMPPLESLDEHSDFSPFFSPGVSEELRRLALRKLFRLPRYHVRDGLDDYDDDYTRFGELGSTVTAEMRHRAEVEARRLAEAFPDRSGASKDPDSASADSQSATEREQAQSTVARDLARPSDPAGDESA